MWKFSRVEVWKFRSVEVWQCGSVEVWQCGSDLNPNPNPHSANFQTYMLPNLHVLIICE